MREAHVGNFDQLLSYDDVDNGILQPKLGEKTFALYEHISKIISNFMIDKKHR